MKLNCDLGEGLDEVDTHVMPLIDMANIACGGHAGDKASMMRSVTLALEHHVSIGAHPSYPDRKNFGRASLKISEDALDKSLLEQTLSLQEACHSQSTRIDYIKPHGALYHDCLSYPSVLMTLLNLAQKLSLPLMLLSSPKNNELSVSAKTMGVELLWEAFADRNYEDDGALTPRTNTDAVHHQLEVIEEQSKHLIQKNGLYSRNNQWLKIEADSLCVHGDSPLARQAIETIRSYLDSRDP